MCFGGGTRSFVRLLNRRWQSRRWLDPRLPGALVVPQGNSALESSLATYETGSVDFLSVLTNFMTVLDYEMNYYDEALNYELALSRLEEMTGQALTD